MSTVKYLDENGLGTVWTKVKGIVTPKADKVSSATNGHLAGLNASGNLTDSGVVASNVALKDGSYSGMTVGTAEDLASASSVASEFTYRVTGGSTSVGKGGTEFVDRIKGRTLVWNQLVLNGDFSRGTGPWISANSTIAAANNELAITPTSSSTAPTISQGSLNFVENHKYYFSIEANGSNSENVVARLFFGTNMFAPVTFNVTSSYTRKSAIVTITQGGTSTEKSLFILVYSGFQQGSAVNVRNIQLIDLTLMFGAGNEPSTVAEFEALYPLPYYEYNAGTLINNAADGLKTVGFNLWDEEWEQGNIVSTTGENGASTTLVRSKNSIKMIPGVTDYFLKTVKNIYFRWYDKAGNYMPFDTSYSDSSHGTGLFSARSGAGYLRIVYSGTTYDNDICISLSDSSRNGTYEPHWEETAALNLGDFKVKSPNIWDEEWENGYYNDSGEKAADNTSIRCKNYVQITANTSYYAKIPTGALRICYYDAGKTFLSKASALANSIFTAPSNARYLTLYATTAYGTTYNHDITICETGHGHDGKYYPHGALTIQGGLKSAGTVYDEISGGKFIQRVGSVDIGTLTWSYASYYGNSFSANVPGMVTGNTNNSLMPRYDKATSAPINDLDKIYCTLNSSLYGSTEHKLTIKDSSYTDAVTFKASLSGVPLYYELATPEDFELLTPIDTAIRNDPYGTEERIPADTAGTVLAPFRADITYSTNIKEAVEHLDENFISVASMTDFLAALNEQMNGTWSMIFKDGKYHFTFTANPEEQ